jgi:hypothetical protein
MTSASDERQSDEIHASFCKALARDFAETVRYVAFDRRNYRTHSIEYLRLLLDAGSEVDALAKLYCKRRKRRLPKGATIRHWRGIILGETPAFPDIIITVFQWHPFTPWKSWKGSPPKNPTWWTAYNEVKHDRLKNFRKANLENVTLALCGVAAFANVLFHYKFFNSIDQRWFK